MKKYPAWLKISIPKTGTALGVQNLVEERNIHTICREAHCPNRGECYSRKTATFLILGNICTRKCSFCAVRKSEPEPIDPSEPQRIAGTAKEMGLRFVVITSVTRDDLADGGADAFIHSLRELHKEIPQVKTELLIPDFNGNRNALEGVLNENPDVLNHNIETVPRLYDTVRPEASFKRSLSIIEAAASHKGLIVKSGIMAGLGETNDEILDVLHQLRDAGCHILTIGQYLSPSARNAPVHRFVLPQEFEQLKASALEMGFKAVESGPLVRSSYRAHEMWARTSAIL